MTMTVDTLRAVGSALDLDECFLVSGRFHFVVGDLAEVVVTLDGAGRTRVDAYRVGVGSGTIGWALDGHVDRVARLASEAADGLLTASLAR